MPSRSQIFVLIFLLKSFDKGNKYFKFVVYEMFKNSGCGGW